MKPDDFDQTLISNQKNVSPQLTFFSSYSLSIDLIYTLQGTSLTPSYTTVLRLYIKLKLSVTLNNSNNSADRSPVDVIICQTYISCHLKGHFLTYGDYRWPALILFVPRFSLLALNLLRIQTHRDGIVLFSPKSRHKNNSIIFFLLFAALATPLEQSFSIVLGVGLNS